MVVQKEKTRNLVPENENLVCELIFFPIFVKFHSSQRTGNSIAKNKKLEKNNVIF